jgi:hypothetical protein
LHSSLLERNAFCTWVVSPWPQSTLSTAQGPSGPHQRHSHLFSNNCVFCTLNIFIVSLAALTPCFATLCLHVHLPPPEASSLSYSLSDLDFRPSQMASLCSEPSLTFPGRVTCFLLGASAGPSLPLSCPCPPPFTLTWKLPVPLAVESSWKTGTVVLAPVLLLQCTLPSLHLGKMEAGLAR